MKVDNICRKHGIGNGTYYKRESKYGGIETSDVKKQKDLEDENNKLIKMFAELNLENVALKVLFEKWVGNNREARFCC